MPGVTAWYGLNRIIAPKAGETVLVSAATGAVGSVVGQLAKIAGARTVGIAGGPEKCAYAVKELGYDACVDHKSPNFAEELKAALPNGIDGLFENVGGEPFRQALRRLNDFARVAICGLIASYEGAPTASARHAAFSSSGASRSKASSSRTIWTCGRRRSANWPLLPPPRSSPGARRSATASKTRPRRWSTCCRAGISARCWCSVSSSCTQAQRLGQSLRPQRA